MTRSVGILAMAVLVAGCAETWEGGVMQRWCPQPDPVAADLAVLAGEAEGQAGSRPDAARRALRDALRDARNARAPAELRAASQRLQDVARAHRGALTAAERALLTWTGEGVEQRLAMAEERHALQARLEEAERKLDALTRIERRLERGDASEPLPEGSEETGTGRERP